MPEISVLMSVHNGGEFINESIESILNQTYQGFEFIIVDDGSTDDTVDIIKRYKDPRIKLYVLKENVGVGAASQYGLNKVSGKYVAKADADDIYISTRLEEQKDFLDNNPDVALIGGLIEYFPHNENIAKSNRYRTLKSLREKSLNNIVSSDDIREHLYWYCCLTHSTIMVRTEIISKVGYIDIPVGEDYNLFYQLNKQGFKMAKLNKILAKVRVSSTSITATNKEIFYRKSLLLIKKDEIIELFKNSNEVYIWGAGGMGKNLLYGLREKGMDVKGFIDIDKKKHGKKINGKIIYNPEKIVNNLLKNKIIVASEPGRFEIVDYLKKREYRHLKDFVVYA